MNCLYKKISSEHGVALLTVLSVSFILFALASVIMMESYFSMGRALRYNLEAQAQDIAQAGISRAIYSLEDTNLFYSGESQTLGQGRYNVSIYNNFTNSNPDNINKIPPYSIKIISEGIIKSGSGDIKKTIETLVTFKLPPYAAVSDGAMGIGTSDSGVLSPLTDFTATIDAIPGYKGDIHNNYSGTDFAFLSNPSGMSIINMVGGTASTTSNNVENNFLMKVNTGGGSVANPVLPREIPDLLYSNLKSSAGTLHSVDEELKAKFGSLAKLQGHLWKDGDKLMADVLILGFIPIEADAGDFLPDGMVWDGTTGTLMFTENKKYKWEDGNMEMENVNIKVSDGVSSAFFVDNDFKSDGMNLSAKSFSVVCGGKIIHKNFTYQLDASPTGDGIAIYSGEEFYITTPEHVPASIAGKGNFFKGIVYVRDGQLKVYNNCLDTDPNTNCIRMEGMLIARGYEDKQSIIVNNYGDPCYNYYLRYNPKLAKALFNSSTSSPELRPIYWCLK